jgi:hypothetical protein
MASAASRQPVYFALTPSLEAAIAPDAHGLLNHIVTDVADALSLACGGAPPTIGYLVIPYGSRRESVDVLPNGPSDTDDRECARPGDQRDGSGAW